MYKPIEQGTRSTQSVIPFILLIVAFTASVPIIAKALDRSKIMAEWPARRCDVGVMFLAPLFQQSYDKRSAAQFSADNFDFCMKSLQTAALDTATDPMYSIFESQLGASNTIASALNNMRVTLSNTFKSTSGLLVGKFYEEFKKYVAAVSLTMQRIKMAMNRVAASTQAMLYMAISTIRAILNAVDFILLVALIIVTILAILFIILFFVLFPSVPLILAVISLIVAAGVEVGNLRDTFCFAPHTLVKLADGSVMPIARLELGEELWGGGKVTGMYMFDGTSSQMFDIYGVHVAGDHIMEGRGTGSTGSPTWIHVYDHPDATPVNDTYCRVYCPAVDNRRLTIASKNGDVVFKDWEEVETAEQEEVWERWVWAQLNPGVEYTETITEVQGFAPSTPVCVYGKGNVPISAVKIGDLVEDDGHGTFTRVLGQYTGMNKAIGALSSNWVKAVGEQRWMRDADPIKSSLVRHLVTESGTFMVDSTKCVRDVTEVGNCYIAKSYDIILSALNSGQYAE